jgi:recombination protein RecA
MLDVRRIETLKNGNDMVGNRVKVKVVKNKVAPPFRQAEFDIMFGKGISRSGSIIDIGVEMEIINKSGAWFNYGDQRIGQGRENAKNFLEEHPAIMDEVEGRIRNDGKAAEILTVGASEE